MEASTLKLQKFTILIRSARPFTAEMIRNLFTPIKGFGDTCIVSEVPLKSVEAAMLSGYEVTDSKCN